MAPVNCSIYGCFSSSKKKSTYFEVCQLRRHEKWRNELLKNIYVTQKHFSPSSGVICSRHFKDDCMYIGRNGQQILKTGSIPTEHMRIQDTTLITNLLKDTVYGEQTHFSFECSSCNVKFESRTRMENHSLKDHGARYICTLCDKKFLSKQSRCDLAHYKRHMMNQHCIDRPLQCDQCGQRFSVEASYTHHLKSHEVPATKHLCDTCGVAMKSERILTSHIKKKHSIKSFLCNYCGATFSSKYDFTKHVQRHTGEKSYVCKECGKGFYDRYHYKIHVGTHSRLNLKCLYCDKIYTNHSSLQNHVYVIHEKPKIPNVEKKIYPRDTTLKTCKFCKAYVQNMDMHIRAVHKGRTFLCELCNKNFKLKHHLSNHLATAHSNIRSFSCSICDMGFKLAAHMRAHMLRKHEITKLFSCSYCIETFDEYNDMCDHTKNEHSFSADQT